jgi:hypothetical protein
MSFVTEATENGKEVEQITVSAGLLLLKHQIQGSLAHSIYQILPDQV